MSDKDLSANNGQKATITVPLTITFELGATSPTSVSVQEGATTSPQAIAPLPSSEAEILEQAKKAFGSRPDVLAVRLGYVFEKSWITKKRAIVVTVAQRKSINELNASPLSALPNRFLDYPVEITTPTLEQLLAQEANDTQINSFSAPNREAARESRYFPPSNIQLKRVPNERMKVKVGVSPENGWKDLKEFLQNTDETLTIAMYDFGAPHIVKCITELAGKEGFKKFVLTLQPSESVGEGTKENDWTDAEVVEEFKAKFGDVFDMAWVNIGSVKGWVNSSYHIKVAVRDHKATHVSSGNYQSSNEPDVPNLDNQSQAFLLRTYNREWNAIIEHEGVAKMFEGFILHDYKNNKKPRRESFHALQDLYLMVPKQLASEEAAQPVEPFPSLEIDREVTVTPLLTPDNYFEEVLDLVSKAKRKLYIQNQTFNAPKENHDKLQQLMDAVLERQEAGVDVKIIFRSMFASTARANVEALADMGFDPQNIKTHAKCHTKGIIVDEKFLLLGSQNWSNDGVSVNRDASLLFEDEEIAQYYERIFLHDWNTIAKHSIGRESVGARIVRGAPEAIAPNMELIPLKDILETL